MSVNLLPATIHPLVRWLSHLCLLPRRAWMRRRIRRPVIEQVSGRNFLLVPEVFNPVAFRTGRYLADYIKRMHIESAAGNDRQLSALDVGTGCGVHAIVAAERGYVVDAVDISPEAVRCATINVLFNDAARDVTVHQGDLFEPVVGKRFDLVMCSLPKFRGQPKSAFDVTWRSADVIDRFATGLSDVLHEEGAALVLLTSHGDERGMLDGLDTAGLRVRIAQRKHFGVEILTIYRVTHASQAPSDQAG